MLAPLALLRYRSNLLGRDLRITNFAGGNTSSNDGAVRSVHRQTHSGFGREGQWLADFYAERTLPKRPIKAELCDAAVVWLAGEQSARTTGHVILVDGGFTEAFLRQETPKVVLPPAAICSTGAEEDFMQRICFVLQVKPERIQEYKERHRSVWPEMKRALEDTGWNNYSLFLRPDGLLVGYLETDDFARARADMNRREVNQRWQREMASFFVHPEGLRPDQAMLPLEEVFHV